VRSRQDPRRWRSRWPISSSNRKLKTGIAICQRLATEPKSIGAIAAAVLGLPDDEQGRHAAKCRFYRLRSRASTRAREARADMVVDEIVEIADAPLLTGSDPIRLKAERRRLQIDARKWAAGKLNRLLYSDDPSKVGVSVTVNNHDGGASALAEIQRRLARKRAALEKENAQAITVEPVAPKRDA
jgi:hypothetical protein